MKRSAIFVNISRGDVVDEAALVAALQRGDRGAGWMSTSSSRVPEPFWRWRT
jgi:phosphoglycerate dehydrogenase-like enzyme